MTGEREDDSGDGLLVELGGRSGEEDRMEMEDDGSCVVLTEETCSSNDASVARGNVVSLS